MDKKSFSIGLLSIHGIWVVLGILIILSALGGCIGSKNKLDADNVPQAASGNNFTMTQYASNISGPNQIRLFIRPSELNRTGRLPVKLKIIDPKLNNTVLTVFKPQFGSEWYNMTNITYIDSHNWTQNFSLKPVGNTSYVLMFVQVYENNTVVKKAAWNLTFDTSVGRPR